MRLKAKTKTAMDIYSLGKMEPSSCKDLNNLWIAGIS